MLNINLTKIVIKSKNINDMIIKKQKNIFNEGRE